jgi:glucuronate isomerase
VRELGPVLVTTHRSDEDEAQELAYDLAYWLAKEAYKR